MKNKYEVRGDVTAIFLSKKDGTVIETIIDTTDLEKAMTFPNTWYSCLHKTLKTFYVNGNPPKKNGVRTMTSLHRYLTDCPHNLEVDHFNHDTLDNRRSSNLRVITHAQNQQNKKIKNTNISGVRGVYWRRSCNKWAVSLEVLGIKMNFGQYFDLDEANEKAIEARIKYMPYSQDAGKERAV